MSPSILRIRCPTEYFYLTGLKKELLQHLRRRERQIPDDEARLVARMVELATQYGRYGYRRVTAILHGEGWKVNPKRVERLWRQEGLKVPSRQPKRRRLWLNDGSCVRLRAARKNHVWSYDFVHERTHDGRASAIDDPG